MIKQLQLNPQGSFSDVCFIIGDEQRNLRAHKNILSLATFEALVQSIYAQRISLNQDNWAPILFAAKKYKLRSLKKAILSYVQNHCSPVNVLGFYNAAKAHEVLRLTPRIMKMLLSHPERIFKTAEFLSIPNSGALHEILSSDHLNMEEIDVFWSALRWAKSRLQGFSPSGQMLRNILGQAFYSIRFHQMSPCDFICKVLPTQMLDQYEVKDIILKQNNFQRSPFPPFPAHPRMRAIQRFTSSEKVFYSEKTHALIFMVDKRVKIHGCDLYHPAQSGCVLSGRILLTSVEDRKRVFLRQSFRICSDIQLESSPVFFDSPLPIKAKTKYCIYLGLDSNSNFLRLGRNGVSHLCVDSVKWVLLSRRGCRETTVHQG
ncbi:Uncharacterized protein FKW44_017720, partial [Caligus rogercresseyi]